MYVKTYSHTMITQNFTVITMIKTYSHTMITLLLYISIPELHLSCLIRILNVLSEYHSFIKFIKMLVQTLKTIK